jgi:hypothetical protein
MALHLIEAAFKLLNKFVQGGKLDGGLDASASCETTALLAEARSRKTSMRKVTVAEDIASIRSTASSVTRK